MSAQERPAELTAERPVPRPAARPAARPGRRRDEAKDDAILAATLELLAERGYDGMTMDAVADRAGAGKATVYRRWPSKVRLAADALVCNRSARLSIDDVPDTGSLRGDLAAMRRLATRVNNANDDALTGVWSIVQDDPEVAAIFREQFVKSKVGLMRAVLERAQARGEVPAGRDLEMIAMVGPALLSYHKLANGGSLEEGFVERMIDEVIVPLATCAPVPEPAGSR
ncbi:TetR/AcrR family transcriptional regulator [Cellulomonas soli]|uniref:Putative TetR-family transcriptional regulator n=1 Tax=Cellulomonas soli TaxID=931535 RepID=A0A512PH71_9CELL|nr:TetR/AcrR family transcriptional regulator [Cellulomonas soli]NYI60848.1 AcrR family transcriptional regulator [Cellulomonas soli]GEP70568.1 putative TetR-family transcriptional regulator [Cellulomonas soli]